MRSNLPLAVEQSRKPGLEELLPELERPLLVDLFCGAGGAAAGYVAAGFRVVGVDVAPQPHYPWDFVQADALNFEPPAGVAAVHASPPCQAYSALSSRWRERAYPDLLAATRELLNSWDRPWVIENVPGAPIRGSLMLCGSSFGLGAAGRQLRRHRYFELSWGLRELVPPCQHEGEAIGVYGHGRWDNNNGVRKDTGPKRRGGYQGSAAEKAEALKIDWMNRDELAQAIPPAYTEWIGRQLLLEVQDSWTALELVPPGGVVPSQARA